MSEQPDPPPPPATPPATSPAIPRRRVHPLTGFVPAFLWGLRLNFGWRRLLLVGGAAVGLAVLIGATAVGARNWRGSGEPDAYFDLWWMLDRSILKFLLPVIVLVTVARSFSSEVGNRTLVYHLVRPIPRATLCLARFFSGVVPGALISWATLFALSWSTGISLPTSYWVSLPLTALVATVAVGAVFFAFSTLLRRGLIAALVYTFVFGPLFAAQRGAIQKLSVMFHVRGVHHGLTDDVFREASRDVRIALQPEDLFQRLSRGDLVELGFRPGVLTRIRDKIAYDTPDTASLTILCITVGLLAFTAWRVSQKDYPLKD